MNLFNEDPLANLLPYGGEVVYYGKVFARPAADRYLEELLNKLEWRHDEAVIMGKHIVTARKVAWYGDEPFSYTYSKRTKTALPWTDVLRELKEIAEAKTGETYNSCLANLYHNGNEGMAWHSDAEKMLRKNGAIASFSFGAERKFVFRHKTSAEKVALVLEHGSLLVMKGETQTNWLHRLPPTTQIKKVRVNLTFRTIVN